MEELRKELMDKLSPLFDRTIAEDGMYRVKPNELDAMFTHIAKLEAKDEWVSIDDGLPDLDTMVLITDGENTYYAQRTLDKDWQFKISEDWNDEEYKFNENAMKLEDVTHWQPLPEPPKN